MEKKKIKCVRSLPNASVTDTAGKDSKKEQRSKAFISYSVYQGNSWPTSQQLRTIRWSPPPLIDSAVSNTISHAHKQQFSRQGWVQDMHAMLYCLAGKRYTHTSQWPWMQDSNLDMPKWHAVLRSGLPRVHASTMPTLRSALHCFEKSPSDHSTVSFNSCCTFRFAWGEFFFSQNAFVG